MDVLAGPFAIVTLLLVVAGATKAWNPGDTATALSAAGVPGGRTVTRTGVRLGGAVEVGIGIGALATGAPVLVGLVALSYAAFAGFVLVALRRGTPISSCGCFGKEDTPPSATHVGYDAAAAVVATLVAVSGAEVALGDVVADQPLAGVPFAILLAVGVYVSYLALTSLPRTFAMVRVARDDRRDRA